MERAQESSPGYARLTQVLTDAVAGGADAVTLEYDSGGCLEVCFMAGNSGAGFALDPDAGQKLIDSLWEEKRTGRGKFRIALGGKDYMVHIKTYDHFGDNAFRLTFHEARR